VTLPPVPALLRFSSSKLDQSGDPAWTGFFVAPAIRQGRRGHRKIAAPPWNKPPATAIDNGGISTGPLR